MPAITRSQMNKELWPGLKALFGLTYNRYSPQYTDIFETMSSDKKFEQLQKISGFGTAPIKTEGSAIFYDTSQEVYTTTFTHATIAYGYSVTQEAVEDNLYESLMTRYTKALGRGMMNTKETIGANVLNNAFSASYLGGDGKRLCATDHPLVYGGVNSNRPASGADLNETALENAVNQVAGWTDDRGILICAKVDKLIIPQAYNFTAERLLKTILRTGTADNDINAINSKGSIPGGYVVNNRLTDTNAWFLKTDIPDGMIYFNRIGLSYDKEGDFDTGNFRAKARERYSFGWADPLGIFGSPGSS